MSVADKGDTKITRYTNLFKYNLQLNNCDEKAITFSNI